MGLGLGKLLLIRKLLRWHRDPYKSLRKMGRYQATTVPLGQVSIHIPDAASFLFTYKEIFKREIYRFECHQDNPYILDGGANIGMATLYWKSLFPKAEIVAFEPDREIFEFLEHNIMASGHQDVKLLNKGLWDESTSLSFESEGSDAGRIKAGAEENSIEVTTLRPFLTGRKVDFLKLDIEGAETVVLRDCASLLGNVENIFVEYHSFPDQEQTLDEVIGLLRESGFRLFVNSMAAKAKSPLVQRPNLDGMDMQLNLFGYRPSA